MALAVLALASCDRAFGLTIATDAPASDAVDAPRVVDAGTPDAARQPGAAHFTFDAKGPAGGPCLLDDSGNGHTGACLGDPVTIVGGRVGTAFDLDGMTRIAIDAGTALGGPGPFTFAGWFDYTSGQFSDVCPFNRPYTSSGADSWQVCIDELGETVFYYSGVSTAIGPVVAQDTWHHVAIVYSGTDVASYVDGVLVMTSPGALEFDFNPILLGADFDGTTEGNEIIGGIDDVWIFDRALSASEIMDLAAL